MAADHFILVFIEGGQPLGGGPHFAEAQASVAVGVERLEERIILLDDVGHDLRHLRSRLSGVSCRDLGRIGLAVAIVVVHLKLTWQREATRICPDSRCRLCRTA